MDISKVSINLSDFIRVYFFIRDGFNKIFLTKFYHSNVYFCYLKNCTGFLGKPYNSGVCSCSRIVISLVTFARKSSSFINIVSSFQSLVNCIFFQVEFSNQKTLFLGIFSVCFTISGIVYFNGWYPIFIMEVINNLPCATGNGNLSSNFTWPWSLSSSAVQSLGKLGSLPIFCLCPYLL